MSVHKGVDWILRHRKEMTKSIDLYGLYDDYCNDLEEVSLETFKRYCREASQHLNVFPIKPSKNKTEDLKESDYIGKTDIQEDSAYLEIYSYDLKTEEELIKYAGFDMDKWEIYRRVVNRWGTGQSPQYQIKCWLQLKDESQISIEEIKEIFDALPSKVNYTPYKTEEGTKLAEIGLADVHMGLQALADETGDKDYSVNIAYELLVVAAKYFYDVLKTEDVDEIIIPVVGDFFNCDFNKATTHGTLQDEDLPYKHTFRIGTEAVIKVTQILSGLAPVRWIICEGNHDYQKSFYFSEFLRAWFRNNENVTVDNSLEHRKFYKWKNNFFMYTHGKDEDVKTLPLRLMQHKKQEYAESDYNYIRVGHLHHKSNGIVKTSMDDNGIEVDMLPSMVGASNWTSTKWYRSIRECICNVYTTSGKVKTLYFNPDNVDGMYKFTK